MLGHALIAAVLALVGVSLLITPWRVVYRGEADSGPLRWAGVACVVVAAIFFGIGFVRRSATEMAVTNKRVIVKSGIIDRRTIELLLPRIESIAIEEPALGRLLGYGTVIVRGTGGTPEVFPQIAGPWNSESKSSARSPGNQSPPERFRLALGTMEMMDTRE